MNLRRTRGLFQPSTILDLSTSFPDTTRLNTLTCPYVHREEGISTSSVFPVFHHHLFGDPQNGHINLQKERRSSFRQSRPCCFIFGAFPTAFSYVV